jgi:Uncharacterised protein family UPF0547
MAPTREYKQCPDCAEHVLLAARKCRFCGYRFDSGRREAKPGTVLSQLIRRTPVPSLPDLLSDWGVSLRKSEEPGPFLLVELDGEPRFMLATSERLVFAPLASSEEPEDVLEYRLAAVSVAERSRRRLTLRGPGFRHVIGGLHAAEMQRLTDHLRQHTG